MQTEDVAKLCDECSEKLQMLRRLLMSGKLDKLAEEVIENFFYDAEEIVG